MIPWEGFDKNLIFNEKWLPNIWNGKEAFRAFENF